MALHQTGDFVVRAFTAEKYSQVRTFMYPSSKFN